MVGFGRSTVPVTILAVLVTVATHAQADVFTFTTADPPLVNSVANNQGWWSATVANANRNDNYFVGRNASDLLNDYFSFHLGSFTIPSGQELLSATLTITRGIGTGNATQTLRLFDVSTAADVLNNK